MKSTQRPTMIEAREVGEVRILRFSHREDLAISNRQFSFELQRFFDQQREESAKVMLIETPRDLLSTRTMDRMWERRSETEDDGRNIHGWMPVEDADFVREEYTLCNFVDDVRATQAFVICTLQGEIDFPFLGPALACDYRVVADNTRFVNRVLSGGYPPFGAFLWFLIRFLGEGRAMDLIWNSRSLEPSEARDLGLVDEVVPEEEIRERALQTAQSFASHSRPSLVALKQARLASCCSLQDYLREEPLIFERWFHAAK